MTDSQMKHGPGSLVLNSCSFSTGTEGRSTGERRRRDRRGIISYWVGVVLSSPKTDRQPSHTFTSGGSTRTRRHGRPLTSGSAYQSCHVRVGTQDSFLHGGGTHVESFPPVRSSTLHAPTHPPPDVHGPLQTSLPFTRYTDLLSFSSNQPSLLFPPPLTQSSPNFHRPPTDTSHT